MSIKDAKKALNINTLDIAIPQIDGILESKLSQTNRQAPAKNNNFQKRYYSEFDRIQEENELLRQNKQTPVFENKIQDNPEQDPEQKYQGISQDNMILVVCGN